MSSPAKRYIRQRPVREEPMDDVLFLIDEAGHAIHMLEGASPGLWNLLRDPLSMTEAKRLLKTAFPGVPAQRIARDVEALFDELDEAGLITHAS